MSQIADNHYGRADPRKARRPSNGQHTYSLSPIHDRTPGQEQRNPRRECRECDRLRSHRDKKREECHYLRVKLEEMEKMNDDLLHDKYSLTEKLKQTEMIIKDKDCLLEEERKRYYDLLAKKLHNDEQFSKCIVDVNKYKKERDTEKKAREEAQQFLSEADTDKQRLTQDLAKTKAIAQERAKDVTQLNDEIRKLKLKAEELRDTANRIGAEIEKKTREECQLYISQVEADQHHLEQELAKVKATKTKDLALRDDEIRKLKQQLEAQQLLTTSEAERRRENRHCQQLAVAQQSIEDLRAINTDLQNQLEVMKRSKHIEITALKKQRKYFESSAENNKRKRLSAEYLYKKKHLLNIQTMKNIHRNQVKTSNVLMDKMMKEMIAVLHKNKRRLNAMNSEELLNEFLNSAKNHKKFKQMAQRIEEKLPEGKINCPECECPFTCVRTLDRHIATIHGIEIVDIADD